MPPLKFPTPMVGLAVTPKSRGDEGKLSGALHKIVEEDPTFHLDRDPQTKELVMTGMSELHLQVIRERLKRRDKVEVDTKEPKIPYRETIQATAEGSYRHKKQTGGRGQFGEVHIRMFPFPAGTKPEEFCTKERFPSMRQFHYDPKNNFLWVDSIVGGTIPNNFLPAVEKGFKERIERGVIAGYQVQNVGVEVHFGKHHDVDSSEAAFKTAGSMAFRNVFQEAQAGAFGADRDAARHRAQRQAGRHQQRHVGPPRPRAGHGFGRRRFANRHRRSAAGRSDDLRPQPVEHHRRPGQLHDGIQPLRRRAGQRAERNHREGRAASGGGGVAAGSRERGAESREQRAGSKDARNRTRAPPRRFVVRLTCGSASSSYRLPSPLAPNFGLYLIRGSRHNAASFWSALAGLARGHSQTMSRRRLLRPRRCHGRQAG